MTQQGFVARRREFWNKVESVVAGGRKEITRNAAWFPSAFRELTQDLNTARANAFDPSIIERLNNLVLAGNQLLYGQRNWSLRGLARFLGQGFPRAVRAQWKGIAAVHLGFYGLALFIGFICVAQPGMVHSFLPAGTAVRLERMYDPDSSHFLKPREVSSDADMFGYYIYNNVSIAFRTFAGGILLGVGSLLILAFNAVFMGAAAAHLVNIGFTQTFFSFVIGHSGLELTAIVFSGYAGFVL